LIAARTGPRFRIRGLAGEFVKEDLDPQEDQLLAGLRPNDPGFGEDPPERWGRVYARDGSFSVVPTDRGDYRWFYEGFRDAIRGDGERPVDPLDSVRGLRVMEAAEESARTGAAVTVSEA
jgi:scyllo-inositol 2-dehydrogenase (NADP+)